ncbi:hypothetical protein [Haloplasma contractile]|uniref:Acetyltransferase protein n=1 Tax=Haloplasma contractile SSD-17B TaxID=1033810 RepID=F7PTT7_9MOLU|nr:hypothetical protein [Haloplasma contractile]ERJ12250.1 acetyltransferase protein [Haloplasma contractile SSD-17B]
MLDYSVSSISTLLKQASKSQVRKLLRQFRCRSNKDVEGFLHRLALKFENANISRTYVILNEEEASEKETLLMGYFTLSSNKAIDISQVSPVNKEFIFGYKEDNPQKYRNFTAAYLIGQVGRNDRYSSNELPGSVIFDEIYLIIYQSLVLTGGRLILLECKDELLNYYKHIGFRSIKNDDTELNRLIRRTDELFIEEL